MVQPSSVNLDVLGVAASSVTGNVGATDPASLPLTYSISSQQQSGTASVSATSGAFTYSLPGHSSKTSDSFVVSVSNGRTQPSTAQVTVKFLSDPLLEPVAHSERGAKRLFVDRACRR